MKRALTSMKKMLNVSILAFLKGALIPSTGLTCTLAALMLRAVLDVTYAGTFTVTNTSDSGAGSLRQAILDANANSGTDTIAFDIPGAGPHTISPQSGLPTITDPVVIDGLTQTGASCDSWPPTLLIELDGTNAGNTSGLSISAGNSTVRGLVIHSFDGNGIDISTNGGNLVECNFIGTDVTGTVSLGNTPFGVGISQVPNNIIGGTAVAARNLLSGNIFRGIHIFGANATGNQVLGNFVGTNVNGTAALGNGDVGVSIEEAPGNTVGGTASGARNIISGNGGSGVGFFGGGASGNFVQGNFIGTDVTGTADLGNSGGVSINGSNNTIGGTTTGALNVISGNDGTGIGIFNNSTGNIVQGNFIGTDVTGTSALGNGGFGVQIEQGASNNIVGGTTAEAGNVISGNSRGVHIFGTNSTGNQVLGNNIGTDITGTVAIGNGIGVSLEETQNNIIGGTTAGARNIISGNTETGVGFFGSGASNNLVQGNYIGTDVNGTADLGNSGTGVGINGSNNTIGGTTAGARNIISGNDGVGVSIGGSGTAGNLVQGNFIGTDAKGNKALANEGGGIRVIDSPNNTIGGTKKGAGNVISGNGMGSTGNGVVIGGSGATGNVLQGNHIGVDVKGTKALGNKRNGLVINLADNTTVGGTKKRAGNIISANGRFGIFLGSNNNIVQGNYIGTDAKGKKHLGNVREGIGVPAVNGNLIGGQQKRAGNVIAFNESPGLLLIAGSAQNRISRNSIFSNEGLGIDLGPANAADGVSANDPGDGDTGPNNLQNFPVLTSAAANGVVIEGTLNSLSNTVFRLEFFSNTVCDDSDHGEGETFLGATTVTTDGSGDASFTAVLAKPFAAGTFLTATATDPDDNTSEFSKCIGAPDHITNLLFLATKALKRGRHFSEGDMHSNGPLEFNKGNAGETDHIGNVTAVGKIKIRKHTRIEGDVLSATDIRLSSNVEITGTTDENAAIVPVPFTLAPFTANKDNRKVRKNKTLFLPPGTYGAVRLSKGATLELAHTGATGEYFFERLEFNKNCTLEIDARTGPVTMNVVKLFKFRNNGKMELLPDGDRSSDQVTLNYLSRSKMKFGSNVVFFGTIVAPNAQVSFSKNIRFRGSVCARQIRTRSGGYFFHHSAGTSLPPAPARGLEDMGLLTLSTDSGEALPTEFALEGNYPNPFNPSTTIRFALPEASKVKLVIYNIRGQLVRTLVSQPVAAGRHKVIWDGRDKSGLQVASGVYLYRLQAQEFVATRKLLLTK
ncbi:MAG: FlgD immunoglobulin-like domain containing protein [bacterium]